MLMAVNGLLKLRRWLKLEDVIASLIYINHVDDQTIFRTRKRGKTHTNILNRLV